MKRAIGYLTPRSADAHGERGRPSPPRVARQATLEAAEKNIWPRALVYTPVNFFELPDEVVVEVRRCRSACPR